MRVSFLPYSHEQIRLILGHRLGELALPIFDNMTVEYLSRRVARVAGDLRAALKICQRWVVLKSLIIWTSFCLLIRDFVHALSTIQIYFERVVCKGESMATSVADHPAGEEHTGRIPQDIVKAALDEYNQDPFKVFIRGACQLDKALIVCACKHVKATGQSELTFAELWFRLKDFLVTVSLQKQVASARLQSETLTNASVLYISLILPPYEVFESAMHRLVHVGIFQVLPSKFTNLIPRATNFVFRREIDPSVVVAALKDTPFMQFV